MMLSLCLGFSVLVACLFLHVGIETSQAQSQSLGLVDTLQVLVRKFDVSFMLESTDIKFKNVPYSDFCKELSRYPNVMIFEYQQSTEASAPARVIIKGRLLSIISPKQAKTQNSEGSSRDTLVISIRVFDESSRLQRVKDTTFVESIPFSWEYDKNVQKRMRMLAKTTGKYLGLRIDKDRRFRFGTAVKLGLAGGIASFIIYRILRGAPMEKSQKLPRPPDFPEKP
jgi:hypothetical protein